MTRPKGVNRPPQPRDGLTPPRRERDREPNVAEDNGFAVFLVTVNYETGELSKRSITIAVDDDGFVVYSTDEDVIALTNENGVARWGWQRHRLRPVTRVCQIEPCDPAAKYAVEAAQAAAATLDQTVRAKWRTRAETQRAAIRAQRGLP